MEFKGVSPTCGAAALKWRAVKGPEVPAGVLINPCKKGVPLEVRGGYESQMYESLSAGHF